MSDPKEEVTSTLTPPRGNRHWSFKITFVGKKLPESSEFVSLMRLPVILAAEPFLQSHKGDEAKVGFRTKDKDRVWEASLSLTQHLAKDSAGELPQVYIGGISSMLALPLRKHL